MAQLERPLRRRRRRLRHRTEHARRGCLYAHGRRKPRLRRAPRSTWNSITTRSIRGACARTSATPTPFGPWSSWTSFLSPTRPIVRRRHRWRRRHARAPAAARRRFRRSAPAKRASRRPNDSATARAVANAVPDGARSTPARSLTAARWEFMDRAVDALRAIDGRYGYNAKRGNMQRSVARRRQLLLRQRRRHQRPPRGLHLRHDRRPLWRDAVADLDRRDRRHVQLRHARTHHAIRAGPRRRALRHGQPRSRNPS